MRKSTFSESQILPDPERARRRDGRRTGGGRPRAAASHHQNRDRTFLTCHVLLFSFSVAQRIVSPSVRTLTRP